MRTHSKTQHYKWRRHSLIGAAACWFFFHGLPVAAQAPASTPNPSGVVTILPAAPEDEENEDLVEAMRQLKGIKIKSLLFDTNDISNIRYSLRIFLKDTQNGDLEDFNPEEFMKKFANAKNVEPQITAFTYPQFFLASIAYRSPDNWSIWLIDNDSPAPHQITDKTSKGTGDITVIDIDEQKVVIQWKPLLMDKVNEVWERSKNEGVQVNEKEGTVTFTLHSNQTFTSFLMRVVDGRLQPVEIGNTTQQYDKNQPAAPDLTSHLNQQESPPVEEGSKEGIMGLLDKYKNMPLTGGRDKTVAPGSPPANITGNSMPGKAAPSKPALPKPIPLNQLPLPPANKN